MTTRDLKKKKSPMTREQEIEASNFFGRHLGNTKLWLSLVVALLLAMLPCIAGISHWDGIAEIVETGIVDAEGKDDSLPRWALVFLLPGLFTLCTAICHGQLYINQRRQKVPPTQIRILGRWTLPVLSIFLCTWAQFGAAGESFGAPLVMPCALGTALILAGIYLFDCKEDALFGLPFAFANRNESVRKFVHRLVGLCWIAAGFAVLLPVMIFGRALGFTSLTAAALVLLPFVISLIKYKK